MLHVALSDGRKFVIQFQYENLDIVREKIRGVARLLAYEIGMENPEIEEKKFYTAIAAATDLRRRTHCSILLDDSTNEPPQISEGIAVCSYEDQFHKVAGRRIALTRALEAAGSQFTSEDRGEIWNQVLAQTNGIQKKSQNRIYRLEQTA